GSPLRRPAGCKIGPAGLKDATKRIVLLRRTHGTAIKALRIARYFAVQQIEIDQSDRTVLRCTVRGKRRCLHQISRPARTGRRTAVDPAAELVAPFSLRAISTSLLDLATETV